MPQKSLQGRFNRRICNEISTNHIFPLPTLNCMKKRVFLLSIIILAGFPACYGDNPPLTRKEMRHNALVRMNDKGRFYITAGLPFVNTISCYVPAIKSRRHKEGVFGLSGGAEYHYSDKSSLSAEANLVFTLLSVNRMDDDLCQLNFQLSHNVNFKRFSLGMGLAVTQNRWDYEIWEMDDGPVEAELSYVLKQSIRSWFTGYGICISAYYKFFNDFRVGVVFRPILYAAGGRIRYAHSLSLDFKFHINFGKPLKPRSYYASDFNLFTHNAF